MLLRFMLLLFLTVALGLASATDQLQEQRIAEALVKNRVTGTVVWLEVGGEKVFALHTLSRLKATWGGVILLHGTGETPASAGVIERLRQGLTAHGWQVLSVQMPISLEPGAWIDNQELVQEAQPRIEAAANYFKQQGIENVSLVGHELGARMTVAYLATKGEASLVRAAVLIDIPINTTGESPDPTLAALAGISLPVLDLYGGQALPAVTGTALQRLQAARSEDRTNYRQDRLDGVNRFYNSDGGELVSRSSNWLRTIFRSLD